MNSEFKAFQARTLICVAILFLQLPPYWYDEIIFISFSKQPFAMLLDTLTAEPHPPGFFLLLKLLPTDNVLLTRLSLLVISYFIVLASLVYGYRTKIIEKLKLGWGIALFFISYSFYSSTAYVRDRSISIPLAIFAMMIIFYLFDRRKGQVRWGHFAGLGALLTALLFISYDVFLIMMVSTAALALYGRRKELFGVIGGVCAGGAMYGFAYGFGQVAGNAERSIWFSYNYNSLVHSFYKHIAGVLPYDLMTDSAVIIHSVLLIFGIQRTIFTKKTPFAIGISVLTVGLFMLSYALRLFPRTHYVAIVYFLVSVIAGWGMESIRQKRLQYALFAIVVIVGLGGYILDHTRFRTLYTELPRVLEKEMEPGKRIGLVADAPILPHVVKNGYFRDEEDLVPMLTVRDEHLPEGEIVKEHLEADALSRGQSLSRVTVQKRLASYGVSDIVYFSAPFRNTYAYDPEQTTLSVLFKLCVYEETEVIFQGHVLYGFNSCVFER